MHCKRLLLVVTLAGAAHAQLSPLSPSVRTGTIVEHWQRRYDHGILGHDSARAVDVDDQGNVLVTGSSLGLVGSYTYEVVTLKYSRTGQLLWERRYNGAGSGFDDSGIAIEAASDGSVYVLGQCPGSSGNQDVVLLKYDGAGTQQWVRTFDNNWQDNATDLLVGPAGEVYVAGNSYYGANVTDVVLMRFDSSGALLWTRNWHGGFGTDWPVAIALDPQGNLDVLGNSIRAAGSTNFDWVVLEYDPSGNLLWTRFAGGSANYPDYSGALHVTSAGDVLVTGKLVAAGGSEQFTTQAYDTSGALLWTHALAGGTGTGKSITADELGRVYVAGSVGFVSYSASGALRWTRSFAIDGALSASAMYVARLPSGRFAVGGSAWLSGTGNQFALAVFDAYGNELQERRLGLPYEASPTAFALAPFGRVLAAGASPNGHDNDALTASLSYQ